MMASNNVSSRRADSTSPITQGIRNTVAVLVMLVSAAAVGVVLVVALVWMLGLVLG